MSLLGLLQESQASKERQMLQKQNEDEELFKYLVGQGHSADSASAIVQKRRETGTLDTELPNFQNAAMYKGRPMYDAQGNNSALYGQADHPNRPVPLPPTRDIPERSTLKDFGPMKDEAIGVYDYNNPTALDLIPVPKNTNIKTLIPRDRPRPGAGKASVDPRVKIAQKLFTDYASNGFATDAQYEMMKTAAPFLGLSLDEVPTPDNPNPPGFFQKILGITPEQAPASPPTQIPRFPTKDGKEAPPAKYDSAEAVRADFKAGKLKREEALKILREQFGHQ